MAEGSIFSLAGKNALVTGVLNDKSLASAIAEALAAAGARVHVTYQEERFRKRAEGLIAGFEGGIASEMDVLRDDQMDAVFARCEQEMGGVDIVVHSIAFAPRVAMLNPFVDTLGDDFLATLNISAYSLVALAQRARSQMAARGGGSIQALTYYGGDKAIPHYNVMGVAKATLQSCVQYLAMDLGPEHIRVNAISPGPMNTTAARGIPGFLTMREHAREFSPLGEHVPEEAVGAAAVYLASGAARYVTGTVHYVDSGFQAVGVQIKA